MFHVLFRQSSAIVKLANSTSPFKFCVFLKEKLDPIDTVYEKHILSFSRPAFCEILTWWNLKGLAELANLTVTNKNLQIYN